MTALLRRLTLFLPLVMHSAVVNPAVAADVVVTETLLLEMEVGQGQMIRLDRPATSVFIADSAVAEAQAMSSQMIFVFGRGLGKTTLYAVDSDEQVVASFVLDIRDEVAVVRGGKAVERQDEGLD
ncbi:MAG: pilus assembly protein N-terminal domain-containing protein [Pseudomonadota bacterium]